MIVTPDRDVKALDAKVTLDGNAMFRHGENAALRDISGEDPQERMAKERGLTYVKLDGDIGILGNGAGLVMSTLDDVVAQAGGSPANFLDAGGGSKADTIASAVEVILSDPKVKAVLFNIFGGITRCDEVAKGLIEAFDQIKPTVPFVVRLDGTNDVEGRRLLAEANLPNVHTESTMDGAAEKVVELAAAAEAAAAASSTTFWAAPSIVDSVNTLGSAAREQLTALDVVGAIEPHDERHRRLRRWSSSRPPPKLRRGPARDDAGPDPMSILVGTAGTRLYTSGITGRERTPLHCATATTARRWSPA